MVLEQYQRDFIDFAIANDVLTFGEFTLKSGRCSPYFFNAGKFNSGSALAKLGQYYAAAIAACKDLSYDVLFGPAYKGIPLAASTVIALAAGDNARDVPYSFNRKEKKDHGEGGSIVGAPLAGKVLVVDDVITAGTAIRESMAIIKDADASLAGVVVAIDRQERGRESDQSAIQEIESEYGVPVIAVVTLGSIVEYLQEKGGEYSTMAAKMEDYRARYGAQY
ncbi:orotate phosphoribosyltransferase [Coemansia sp. RSA 1822]|nr:orotate phosphoribosyltransferase [Coemansia sp. RSA 638]KAJ2121626.1 orotate phosphoribosyltransferase [Coemansia sp. RSA 720]KAJ2543237.1 orotate phosphoribosyltransferase [Coemansia sp. RSA 1853]KAJ2563785.1 orotate phosphoribosyltransferase [Coemansia sp. RSA 1822]KAJ2660602.1 orotate phosphoribosyltransferase [Coemansia sp. RSA 1199]